MAHIFMQKSKHFKRFYVFLWATTFSEDTCFWMRAHAMPIHFVSGEVTGVSSVLCLAGRMAKFIFPHDSGM